MQITPGHAPLTLALLKALGGQGGEAAAPLPAKAAEPPATAPTADPAAGPGRETAGAPLGTPAEVRSFPRGSFLDLRV